MHPRDKIEAEHKARINGYVKALIDAREADDRTAFFKARDSIPYLMEPFVVVEFLKQWLGAEYDPIEIKPQARRMLTEAAHLPRRTATE